MSASMNTILIFGGSAGIGAAFAKRFHSAGKQIIITGRDHSKLKQLETELPGVKTYVMDMSAIKGLSSDIAELFKHHPDIDTVWINGGVQKVSKVKDITSATDSDIELEIATNVTAPAIIARHVIPRLLEQRTETNIMITGSGLGFMPMGAIFPVYCATKAAVHSYCVGIRQALKDTKVNVLELVPPYVGTQLDYAHKDLLNGVQPMDLDEFVNESFKVLDGTAAADIKEIAPGTAGPRVALWRDSIGKVMAERGLDD